MKDAIKTILVDLSPSKEELFKIIHKNARWGIKRAQKEGLTVVKNKGFKDFYKIYLDSMKQKNVTPFFPDQIKKETKVFFGCKYKGKIIAGLVVGINENTGLLEVQYNSSLNEYQALQPNDLLYWTAILWAKKQGHKKLDLGGYSVKPHGDLIGVNKFKEKWSKDIVTINKDFPLTESIKRKLLRNSAFAREVRDKLRKSRNEKSNIYKRAEKALENMKDDGF